MTTSNRSASGAAAMPVSPAVRAGDFIYVSGQVATDDDGRPYVGDFSREVRGAFTNLELALESKGGVLADVVKIGAYLTNATLFAPFNELYRLYFPGRPPARTTVVVAFGHPDVRLELDAVAFAPPATQGRGQWSEGSRTAGISGSEGGRA